MKNNISFSILGLGRVVEKRIYVMFKIRAERMAYVQTVFDKDKKTLNKYYNAI